LFQFLCGVPGRDFWNREAREAWYQREEAIPAAGEGWGSMRDTRATSGWSRLMPKWSEEGRRREQAAGGGGERRRRGSGGRFEAGSGLGVPARRGKSVWGLGAATGLPQAADGARHGPAMAAAAALRLPLRASRGAGQGGRQSRRELRGGSHGCLACCWLTRALGLRRKIEGKC